LAESRRAAYAPGRARGRSLRASERAPLQAALLRADGLVGRRFADPGRARVRRDRDRRRSRGSRHRPRIPHGRTRRVHDRRRRLGRPAAAPGGDDLRRPPALRDGGADGGASARRHSTCVAARRPPVGGWRRRRLLRPRIDGVAAADRRRGKPPAGQLAALHDRERDAHLRACSLGSDRRLRRCRVVLRRRFGELPRQRDVRDRDAGGRARASGPTALLARCRRRLARGAKPSLADGRLPRLRPRERRDRDLSRPRPVRSQGTSRRSGGLGPDRPRDARRRPARRRRRLPDPPGAPGSGGICDLVAVRRTSVCTRATVSPAGDHGCRRDPRGQHPDRQRALGDRDAAGGAARPACQGWLRSTSSSRSP
jgi:hypothetical protein